MAALLLVMTWPTNDEDLPGACPRLADPQGIHGVWEVNLIGVDRCAATPFVMISGNA